MVPCGVPPIRIERVDFGCGGDVCKTTGYRSSEAELSAVRKLNPFGTCD
jgi:hypothetical protein